MEIISSFQLPMITPQYLQMMAIGGQQVQLADMASANAVPPPDMWNAKEDSFELELMEEKAGSTTCYSYTELVQIGEGYDACPYKDTMGHPTVCWGYNLDNYNAKTDVANAGGSYTDLMNG